MANKKIRIQLTGSPGDNEDVRLDDFIQQLHAVEKALRETERLISGHEQVSIGYKVVGLSRSSPSSVELEPVPLKGSLPQYTDAVVDNFSNELELIKQKGELIGEPELERLHTYRELGSRKENLITRLRISVGLRHITIDHMFQEKLNNILGPDELIGGSVSGMLEALNFHNTNKFTLYPFLGARKVFGTFTQQLRPKVKDAVGNYVTVIGELRYKQWSAFPHGIIADDLDIHPPESELPTLTELRGAFAGVTGDLNSVEYIDNIRNASW